MFCSKNISAFENTIARTVNVFVNNGLVKLTMLWTTGPRISTPDDRQQEHKQVGSQQAKTFSSVSHF